MKNKKKKGFTLIELLAIIVILAIIAVITVPIILNIIEESKKGAAKDSTYGYKDSVNKYYVGKLAQDSSYTIPNGTYTVNGSNGYLTYEDTTLEITVSGTIPSAGAVELEKNNIKNACLKFGDYAVPITNGAVGEATKGSCNGTSVAGDSSNNSSQQGSNTPTQNKVAPVVYTATWNDDERTLTEKTVTSEDSLAIGDYVKLGENDGFYVINPNRNGNVVLMSEYNISNSSSETGYNALSNGIMLMSNRTYVADNTTSTWRQAYHEEATNGETIILPDAIYYDTSFSDDFYWEAKYGVTSDCSATYCPLYSGEEYAYIYDTNSNLYGPMEDYKDYLKNETGLELTVRAMSYSEANSIISNSWAYNQAYWLGSENSTNGYLGHYCSNGCDGDVWTVRYNSGRGDVATDFNFSSDHGNGVRPVIEISISEF